MNSKNIHLPSAKFSNGFEASRQIQLFCFEGIHQSTKEYVRGHRSISDLTGRKEFQIGKFQSKHHFFFRGKSHDYPFKTHVEI